MEEFKKNVIKFLTDYGFQLVGAIIILGIGIAIARWLGEIMMRWLNRREMEPPLRILIVRVVRLLIIGFTLVLALEKFGVNIAALIAGIGVAGVGVGLAMQGVLSNLVAGLTIIFTKPFRVGEYVELLGVQGQVNAIELFSTTLLHPDRSIVVVPNRKIVGEVLHNYGTVRQLDLSVNVAFTNNLNKTFAVIRDILSKDLRVLKEPSPMVGVKVLEDSGIAIAIRPWISIADYGAAQAELCQAIIERFRQEQITIPFPQREIRILNDSVASPPIRS